MCVCVCVLKGGNAPQTDDNASLENDDKSWDGGVPSVQTILYIYI